MTNIGIPSLSPAVLEKFSEGTKSCIKRLMAHTPRRHDLTIYSRSRLAAVLILLYEQAGELRVLLTTRSKALRTHAGQTALPGGRVDESDRNFIDTAYREAHEEVALPLNSPDIHTISVLEPFISLHKVIVTPIVAILTCPAILDKLKAEEDEVACIFTHPLRAILDPSLAKNEPLVESGGEDWPYDTELYSTSDSVISIFGSTTYRMHRFRSSASPIKGLTADILIKTAQIAFGQGTAYDRYAPMQPHGFAETCHLVDEYKLNNMGGIAQLGEQQTEAKQEF